MLPLFQKGFRARVVWIAVLAQVLSAASFATTVAAPAFDSLVQQSDYVVRGKVTSVSSEWREQNGNRNIVTLVGIDVSEIISGTPPTPLVLLMLGGKVGDKELIVQGSPVFSVGDEHILFLRGNGVQFNPLVALMHGQYPVKKDAAGRAFVTRSDGSPLHDEKEVSLPMESHAHSARSADSPPASASQSVASEETAALSVTEFTARIRASRQKPASPDAK